MMKLINNPYKNSWKELCVRPQLELEFLESSVKNILNRVHNSGDAALFDLAEQYDHVKLNALEVSEEEKKSADLAIPDALKNAIKAAASNIEKFHNLQRRTVAEIETMPGVICWRKEVAIQNIGIYIPGGSAPLFSTVLMLGIPAKLAGCKQVVLCSPPSRDGTIDPAILFAASLAGIKQIFKVGGAQAIAALAYGTETIAAVSKIFGPGNQYVTKAKLMVSQQGIAIDMPAGPSEVLIFADEHADASFVASDLLAQAEHGPDSQVVLVTNQTAVVEKIMIELAAQIEKIPRKEIAKKAIANSLALVFDSVQDSVGFINEFAPEHLIINRVDCDAVAEQVLNAGSVFLGPWSPESAGDYASGTNHTLPTNGYARAYSGVSLESFTKVITFQKISEQGIREVGPIVELMAEAEQLIAHKESISIRLRSLK